MIKILIVEDELLIAKHLQKTLEEFGYEVCGIASTGKRAFELVEEHKPEIVLEDIVIRGDMDGVEVASILITKYNLPVIFCTAYSDERIVKRVKEVGAAGFILKPYRPKELQINIEVALYKHDMDRKIKEYAHDLFSIFTHTNEGIIALNEKGKVQFMNRKAQDMTEWSIGLALYRDYDEVCEIEVLMDEDINNSIFSQFLISKSQERIPVEINKVEF